MTVEDLVQAQKEIMAHNMQLKERTKQLEKDMDELKDQSLLLVRPSNTHQKNIRVLSSVDNENMSFM